MATENSTPIRGSATLSITPSVIKRIEPTGKLFKLRDTTTGLILLVTKAGAKTWYLDYRANGKRQSYKLGTIAQLTTNEARKVARYWFKEIAKGADPATEKRQAIAQVKAEQEAAQKAARRTVGRYLDTRYLPHHLAHTRGGEGTAKAIRSAFKDWLDSDMASLTVKDFEKWAKQRLDDGNKPATINRLRNGLMALLNHAVEKGVLDSNPLAKWNRLEVKEKHRVRYLGSRDQYEDHEKGERERFELALQIIPRDIQTIVRVAIHTGMRRGEIFDLRWKAVDFKTGIITIERSKSGKKRHIPMNARLNSILKEWRGNVLRLDADAYVFPSPKTGGRRDNINKQWAKLTKKAELTDFHFHDCRHDAASRMLQQGEPIAHVSRVLGHSSIEITERVYGHLAPDHLRSAVEKLS